MPTRRKGNALQSVAAGQGNHVLTRWEKARNTGKQRQGLGISVILLGGGRKQVAKALNRKSFDESVRVPESKKSAGIPASGKGTSDTRKKKKPNEQNRAKNAVRGESTRGKRYLRAKEREIPIPKPRPEIGPLSGRGPQKSHNKKI